MARRFAVTGQMTAVTAGLKTMLDLVGSATARPEITKFYASASAGIIADQSVRLTVMRHTTVNTGTAVVPVATDGTTMVAVATALEQCTAEGTYTAASECYDQAQHLRSQHYWQALDPLGVLVVPNSANNGIGMRVIQASGAYGGTYDGTIEFQD